MRNISQDLSPWNSGPSTGKAGVKKTKGYDNQQSDLVAAAIRLLYLRRFF
jgi:hypothetical protein